MMKDSILQTEAEVELISVEKSICEYEDERQKEMLAYLISNTDLNKAPLYVKELHNKTRFSKNLSNDLKC